MESIVLEGRKQALPVLKGEEKKMSEIDTKREILKIWFLDAADTVKKLYGDYQTAQIYRDVAYTIDNIMSCTCEEAREMYAELMQNLCKSE